jgi:hypothetical protein
MHQIGLEGQGRVNKPKRKMAIRLYSETSSQFLARMILATREAHQISSADAQRLSELAQFGTQGPPTTMPEERRDSSKPLRPTKELVND